MTISLPTVISDYLAASDRGDLDALVACFTDDAVVLDEDQEWRGQAGIRQFKILNGLPRRGFQVSSAGRNGYGPRQREQGGHFGDVKYLFHVFCVVCRLFLPLWDRFDLVATSVRLPPPVFHLSPPS